MLELAADVLPLLRAGHDVAAVTVTGVARSAPRGAGAAMAVTRDARVIGSISGGCVEGDAAALALTALATGAGRVSRFGFTDEEAYAAGLACGGAVDAVISVLRADDPDVITALERVAEDRAVSVGVVVSGPRTGTVLGEGALAARADDALADGLRAHRTGMLASEYDGERIFLLSSRPRPRLILLGAGEHAAALCRVGTAAGFAVTVCDVWELLATRERFPHADEIVTALPQEHLAAIDPETMDDRTAVCVLTHDERIDVPSLQVALTLPVGFVGAMGARSTVARRAAQLKERGVPAADVARIHSPLGMDLGGSSPDETALAVLAEIVAVRHGGTGVPLRERTGPVHRGGDASTVPRTAEEPVPQASASCSLTPLPMLG